MLDPWALKKEIETLNKSGIEVNRSNLIIAENTPLILPYHRDLDLIREEKAGYKKIGNQESSIVRISSSDGFEASYQQTETGNLNTIKLEELLYLHYQP